MQKDYYKILGLEKNADKEEIKKAYRILAKKFHPDVNIAPGSDEIFIEITEAYEFLMNIPEDSEKQKTENYNREEYERIFREEIRKRAEEHARMKYQKFVNQHEAFKTSGVHDIAIIFQLIGRVFLFVLTLLFFTIPVILSFFEWQLIFLILFLWPCAFFFSKYIYEKRKNYFFPNKFYYNYGRLKSYFSETDDNSEYKCFYCKNRKANSKPYKIYLLKVKDVQLINDGPMLHQVRFKRTYKTIKIPRSQKALINHTISSVIKFLCVFILPFFIPIHDFLWKIALSILTGVICSSLFLLLSQTRSKVTYFLYPALLIKIALWISVLIAFTNFKHGFLNAYTYEFINAAIFILIMLDPLYEQLMKSGKKNKFFMYKPVSKKYNELNSYFNNHYQYYIDLPIWTIIYPMFKWVFG